MDMDMNMHMDMDMDTGPRFICDRMLGSLARWLRLLGFDTSYPPEIPESEIRDIAVTEKRYLLTRDRGLAVSASSENLLICSLDTFDQLEEVNERFRIFAESRRKGNSMSRCSLCNTLLGTVEKCEVEGEVPPGVYEKQDRYWHCAGCGKYYWPGTHYGEILNRIETLK